MGRRKNKYLDLFQIYKGFSSCQQWHNVPEFPSRLWEEEKNQNLDLILTRVLHLISSGTAHSRLADRNDKHPATLPAHTQLGVDDVGVDGGGGQHARNQLADVHPHVAVQNSAAILKTTQQQKLNSD